jgi:hypothetical protein
MGNPGCYADNFSARTLGITPIRMIDRLNLVLVEPQRFHDKRSSVMVCMYVYTCTHTHYTIQHSFIYSSYIRVDSLELSQSRQYPGNRVLAGIAQDSVSNMPGMKFSLKFSLSI